MRFLKYISLDVWAKIYGQDYRSRFFVEVYIEKLRMYTPPFHQTRLMNVFSACEEMLVYLDEVALNEKNGSYVESALKELNNCLVFDPVASDLFIEHKVFVKELMSSPLNGYQLKKIGVICRSILGRIDAYRDKLRAALMAEMVQEASEAAALRIIQQIEKLTGLYITDLLNQGYSPTYLYHRSDAFRHLKSYGDKSFQEQLKAVGDRLSGASIEFHVHYGISTNKNSALHAAPKAPCLEFISQLPQRIKPENLEKMHKDFEGKMWCRATVSATDYISAALKVKEELDGFLDTFTPFEFDTSLKISSHALITYNLNQHSYQHCINVGLLTGFMTVQSSLDSHGQAFSLTNLMSRLDSQAVDQLSRSLRHLRLARETSSLEQKMLNLWISLEALFPGIEGSIIGSILEFLPELYAVQGVSRRINYIASLLSLNEISVPEKAKALFRIESERFGRDVSADQLFRLIKDDDASKSLYDSIDGMEHLRFRLSTLRDELKSSKTIKARIDKTQEDVALQLRRIYFYRNKIAHTGHFKNVKPQLIMHLTDYLSTIYECLVRAASISAPDVHHSISDLLISSKMGSEKVLSFLRTNTEVSSFSNIALEPLI